MMLASRFGTGDSERELHDLAIALQDARIQGEKPKCRDYSKKPSK